MITSKQRFVKEYANWKIGILKDLTKNFPEKELGNDALIALIKVCVKRWEQGMCTTEEIMRKLIEL